MSRYLIGTGNRNWNDIANWSDTSGGAGGFSVPTSADNVIFDANSGTGTITVNAIANTLDFTCTNIGALSLVNAAYAFNVFGSLTLHTNLTVNFTSTGYLYMKATDSRTITTNGKVANWNRMYFDGVGGSWTNQDDMSITPSALYCVNGTWTTNNKTILVGERLAIIGNVTLNYGSSIITAHYYRFESTHTVNAGTSTINAIYYFWGGGKTYYNVVVGTFYGKAITGANTFNNLTFLSSASISDNVSFDNNQLISGDLTINGYNSTNYRLLFASNTIGTPRTITCNGTVTASNVDFRDITLAGTCNKDLSAIAGGSGDCGGNTGITFTTAQPQWYKHTSGACNWSDSKWYSNQGKTIVGRIPLPQDDATFDATSFTGTSTLSVNCPRIGRSLDMSGVNQAVTFSLANAIEVYGSYVLGNNITQTGNSNTILMGRGSKSINSYEKTIYNLFSFTGDLLVLSNLNITNDFTNDYNCQTDFNNFNLTSQRIYSQFSAANTRTPALYLRNGIFNLNPLAGGNMLYIASANVNCGNAIIICNPSTFSGNLIIQATGKIINQIKLSGTNTGNFDFLGSNTIAELIIDSGRKVRFTAGTTQTINKATIGANVTLNCITSSTYNLALGEIATAENINIKGCTVTQDSKFFAEANSVDSGSNNRVVFGDYFTPQEILIE